MNDAEREKKTEEAIREYEELASQDSRTLVERALIEAFINTDTYHNGYHELARWVCEAKMWDSEEGRIAIRTLFEDGFKTLKFVVEEKQLSENKKEFNLSVHRNIQTPPSDEDAIVVSP
jgi:hypothetical protein